MSDRPLDLLLLAGNHLYPLEHLAPYRRVPIVMVEDHSICIRRPYHQQKLGFVLAAMREHARQLQGAGYRLHYYSLKDGQSISGVLAELLPATGASCLGSFDVADDNLATLLARCCARQGVAWRKLGDPGFLTSRKEFAAFASGKRQLRMASFYMQQRRRMGILLEPNGKPMGGRWSHDVDNRKRLPKHQATPSFPTPRHSKLTLATIAEVGERFAGHPGVATGLWLPTTRDGALAWLRSFIDERLVGFGTYEDALTERSPTLFHSVLSPLLNVGLLTPHEVVAAVVDAARDASIALNDVEGFVRQVIGWREFVRGVYDQRSGDMRGANHRNQTRTLAPCWFDGNTGIPPLDQAIKTHVRLGWNHHIERLMVIANLMNLCEIHPKAVYEYFMCNYIDAYDWVMVPNVYGMGLNSDGGVFATKPYIGGSNYLLKMSDYRRGDWCDVVDGLYWRFVDRNREELASNPRLAIMPRGLDRLKPQRRAKIFAAAEGFLAVATNLSNTTGDSDVEY